MKKVTIFANLAFIIFILFLFFSAGSRPSEKDILIFIAFITLPFINLIAFWRTSDSRDIVSLFIERKKLEQEKKIAELQKSLGKDT